jgi:hypothetical protein
MSQEVSGMIQSLVQPFKELLPKGKRYRKLAFGHAAGCVMEIDFNCQLRTYLGLHEFELNPYFKRMVTPGANCFDIGGKEGYNALMMAKLSRGRVVSFDCDHAEIEHMRRTFGRNPELSIQAIEAFVGSVDSDGYMTIDRASRELFVPSFIKMDIEGGEDIALEGASETLATHSPSLIIEVHGADKEQRCVSTLRGFGYKITVINQSRFFRDSARTGYNRWIAAFPAIV